LRPHLGFRSRRNPNIELSEEAAQPTPAQSDATDDARLVSEPERFRGIYAGQIDGRIDRAWMRDDEIMRSAAKGNAGDARSAADRRERIGGVEDADASERA
jgi:hypothetical protein